MGDSTPAGLGLNPTAGVEIGIQGAEKQPVSRNKPLARTLPRPSTDWNPGETSERALRRTCPGSKQGTRCRVPC